MSKSFLLLDYIVFVKREFNSALQFLCGSYEPNL